MTGPYHFRTKEDIAELEAFYKARDAACRLRTEREVLSATLTGPDYAHKLLAQLENFTAVPGTRQRTLGWRICSEVARKHGISLQAIEGISVLYVGQYTDGELAEAAFAKLGWTQ